MAIHNLFISHSWAYGDAYEKLRNLLANRPYYNFRDYSVPSSNPIHGASNIAQLEAKIEQKMRASSIVIVMAGKYATYSDWINRELKIAKKLGKPILAIKPFGSNQISSVVSEAADSEVGWSTESIVTGIRELLS